MTLLDLALLATVVLSAVAGFRMGFLVRAAGLGGVAVGLVLSALFVPAVIDLVSPRTVRGSIAVTGLLVVVATVVAMVVLQTAAMRVRRRIAETGWRPVDATAGAVTGLVGALVFVWFAAPLAAMVPGPLAREVRNSTVVAVVTELGPRTANPLAALGTLLADTRFPEVFTDLAPAPSTGLPPADLPLGPDVVASASASAVKLEVLGCGSAYTGSGWVVADDLVVTNAHVVAGAEGLLVRLPDGSRLEGEVVVFDDDRDLALVAVDRLGLAPLPRGPADPGDETAVFGHPRGQEQLRIAPARVARTLPALGRDVYGLDRTERQVVVLAAELAQGDSGSPVVDVDGRVIGTVFAISPDDAGTAYALADAELDAVLGAPRRPGDAGRCA